MLRLLHTSDWHLGGSLGQFNTYREHEAFLDWLVRRLDDRAVDVLILAGDVFHYSSPSNRAREIYYEFLHNCSLQEYPRQVVVVGGNHDSPSGLEAPQSLLSALDVKVIGKKPDELDELLVPVTDDNENVAGVIVAVPYLNEKQLGVSLGRDTSPDELTEQFQSGFAEVYRDAARLARDKWGDAPLIATGHMTAMESNVGRDDDRFETALHRIGSIDTMSPDVFGDAYDYVALGHIHSMMRVGDSDCYYSGTPVPTRRVESKSRYILDVEFDNDGRQVKPVEVPIYRRILNVEGDYEAIKDQLADVEVDSEYNPALFVRLDAAERKNIHELEVELESFLDEQFNDSEQPRIADLEIYRSDRDEGLEAEHHVEDPDELDPVEMFERLYDKENPGEDGPPEELMNCYETVLEEVMQETREENSE